MDCAFNSFRRARLVSNVVKDSSELDGFELIKVDDKLLIKQRIESENATRKTLLENPKPKTQKCEAPARIRKLQLKQSTVPAINVMFTNSDQLTAEKMCELKSRVLREKPHIIAISEVKPKNGNRRTLEDYQIPGFSIHHVNLDSNTGRGIAVYTHEALDKSVIQINPEISFEIACLLEIRLRGGDLLLFGCFYRSPTPNNTSDNNNDKLNRLLKCLSKKTYSHKCLVGDFNYRDINWASWTTSHNEDSKEHKFIETIRDSYFHQHNLENSRTRGNDQPSLIDLVFTDESMQISELVHHSPLGKSDHSVICFKFNCYLNYSTPKERYMYHKADFEAIRDNLIESKWEKQYVTSANDKTIEEL